MNKKYCVYKHVAPEPDGRVYVGKTCQLPLQRWRRGYDGNVVFQHAVEEYGNVVDAFEHYILAPDGEIWLLWDKSMSISNTNRFDFDEASELEAMWIKIYDALDYKHGFNRQSGGDQGFVVSEQAKEYMSEIMTGRYVGEHNPFSGQHHTKETRLRLSELAKQRTGSKNPFWGKRHTVESKERQRRSKSGRYIGKDNPYFGKHHSAETKAHLSKLRSKPVEQYDADGNLIARHPSALSAANAVGVSVQAVSDNCRGKTKICAGCVFKYT